MKSILLNLTNFLCVFATLDTDWWKNSAIYELMIPTFKDSDGDGIGDLQGVISKLDHFTDLGIDVIFITPFYKTDMKDMGYDVIDYYQIDPKFGSEEDFNQLITELKARGISVILDLVINHSSNEHYWFKQSVERIDPYTDYYVWANPVFYAGSDEIHPPNDWNNMYKGSAWTWNENRKQYYYHTYSTEQPDLNLRNENVKQEIKKIVQFWFDRGVNGFRLQAAVNYMEDKYLRNGGHNQAHMKESLEFIHEIRNFVDEYNNKNGGLEKILAPEAHASPEQAVNYFSKTTYPMTHFVFNYHLEYQNGEMNAYDVENVIFSSLSFLPKGENFAWVIEDHNTPRTGSRIGKAYSDIFTIITALLPGIFYVYYGQEIGLLNGIVRSSQFKDYSTDGWRDPNRLIMQWDDSISAGFSSNRIPFSPACMDYTRRNVKVQKYQENSQYNLMKSLIALRKTKTVKYGEFYSHVYSSNVYIFWRLYSAQSTIIAVVINFDNASAEIDIKKSIHQFNKPLNVVAASINSGYKKGDIVGSDNNLSFMMKPQSAIVLTENYENNL